nr:MFS transporter [Alteromonas sp. B31-7]
MFAMFLVVWAIPKLVLFFGGGNEQKGYPIAMLVMSVLAIICFVLCYFFTSEEKFDASTYQKAKLSDFYTLIKNSQWTLVALISLFTLILIGVRSSVAPHYIKYYLEAPDLLSPFLTVAATGSVLGAIATHLLTKKIQKIRLFKIALWVVIVSHLLFFIVPSSSLSLIFGLFFIANFAHMIITPLMFSMVADTIDFGEKMSGKKLTAIAFSGHLLAIKLGFAIGGALAGWLLSMFGYIANQSQSAEALQGILIAFAGIPTLCMLAAVLFISRYRLTETTVLDIQHSLSK